MLTQTQVKEIMFLKESGFSNRNIAEVVGYHENTVSKVLKRRERTEMNTSKLDAFKDYLKDRINQYPKITSKVLLEEIIRIGYTGKATILYDYLRSIRPDHLYFS